MAHREGRKPKKVSEPPPTSDAEANSPVDSGHDHLKALVRLVARQAARTASREKP